MIDDNLLLLLELSILIFLCGLGIWRIYRTLWSPTTDAPAETHDMRQEGERLSLQTDSR
jgi:hypothetical protein